MAYRPSKLLSSSDEVAAAAAASERDQLMLQNERRHQEAALRELKADDGRDPGSSPLASVLGLACFPFTALLSWMSVDTNEEIIVLSFGQYAETARDPGLHFSNCFGREVYRCSTKKRSIELPKTTVIDSNGNPLIISAVIVYQFVNTKRAILEVENADGFVKSQAECALKQTLSHFPYESHDGSPCLKTEAQQIGEHLSSKLQDKISQAGALAHSFQLKEISYAPEIASGMLKRQQAVAIIQARQTIVEGAVDIATHTLEKLSENGIQMKNKEKSHLVTNLLTVFCGEGDSGPQVSTASSYVRTSA
eukprot:CAMPEP_0114628078 /NCGR_PEP_ID=MMETSP0168-20121206/12630_1 /TAXON_ID=95228 ORGANISM="Vannella sp., Strain DIVA3 517/6/12" /NCGR_SAMPLE_ID=MMETSP0168 /ASSEMBLY_ACC=CAM_ASM_000044 /LENGTH=306 /DNA_ID=CAMNT_0001839439 /DNA_START=24 /DNA_END=941 /DNA_ORIENTATION=-